MMSMEVVVYFRYAHGLFNLSMAVMFFYTGTMGFRSRKTRKTGSTDARAAGRHRRLGPVLAPLGVAGFFAGLALVYLDEGRALRYPLHFLTGLAIAVLIVSTFIVSRRIRGQAGPWRDLHFSLGVGILCLYVFQVFLGLGILL
jgi:hypothetical protein